MSKTETTKDEKEPILEAWENHTGQFGAGYQDQSFEAGWNAALECAHDFLLGHSFPGMAKEVLSFQGELE